MATFPALLRDRARELTRHLASAIKGEVTGVHQGRVASRRLRESLPIAGATAARGSAERARRAMRQVTRALGPVRELDVALEHLEDGIEGARIPRAAIERVRMHVLAERERRREKMLSRIERVDLEEALARVERVAEAVPPRVLSYSRQAVRRRVQSRAEEVGETIERAGTLYDPDRLHAVRIAVKKLRYALEVAAQLKLADARADLRRLKAAQETLGIMHDYHVLLEHVQAVSDESRERATAAAGLHALASAYDGACRRLHARYLKQAPGLAEIAVRHASLARRAKGRSQRAQGPAGKKAQGKR